MHLRPSVVERFSLLPLQDFLKSHCCRNSLNMPHPSSLFLTLFLSPRSQPSSNWILPSHSHPCHHHSMTPPLISLLHIRPVIPHGEATDTLTQSPPQICSPVSEELCWYPSHLSQKSEWQLCLPLTPSWWHLHTLLLVVCDLVKFFSSQQGFKRDPGNVVLLSLNLWI